MTRRIDEHRKKIDELDAKILELIQDRVQESISIRKLKIDNNIPLFTPERERELVQRLTEMSGGRLPDGVIKKIWESIIQGGKQTPEK